MLELGCPDLARDPLAICVVKDEVVEVEFAAVAGLVMSAVGPNHYVAGDALVSGSTGDRWCVSRERFDAKYRPAAGQAPGAPGAYRNVPVSVWAKQIAEPFHIARAPGGDVLSGEAGDWALQYAANDCGLVARLRFEAVYRFR
ncbi:MAG: PGDYG domain-containing protein [Pseudomonadota bacterium]